MDLAIASKAPLGSTLPSYLVAAYVNHLKGEGSVPVVLQDSASVSGEKDGIAVAYITKDSFRSVSTEPIIKHLVTVHPLILSNSDPAKADAISEWISKAVAFGDPNFKKVEQHVVDFNTHLTLRSYVVGYTLSAADLAVWGTLRGNNAVYANIKRNTLTNLCRWFRYIEEANPWIHVAITALESHRREAKTAKSTAGANYEIALPDTEKGVVTRFPPEPSGYLHIGHAKAALLNDYFAHEKYKGTMLVRFDDTNPSKEKVEFEDAIVEDLALMGIKPDKVSHTSDWFEELYQFCIKMIKDGNAYADDTIQEKMRDQRMHGEASVRRGRTIEENLEIFEEMKKGSEVGLKNCIRAKISVDNPNKAMRDPVIYRCNPTPHHRTGSTWKIYPTYDFCCPIVDSIEGVTHALRTIEYRDRNPQYAWVNEALKLRPVHVWDFARMNFIRTLLSKRKLTQFVEEGRVWGWDDPRFPTIRGVRRRGMTIEALREFILKQGPSKNIVNLDWTLFWATNKKYIDPVAPRHTVVAEKDAVMAIITSNGPKEAYVEDRPKHGKNPAVGTKKVLYGPKIILEQEDAQSFAQDEEITLMSWGNAIVRKIIRTSATDPKSPVSALELELHLDGDVKKTAKKVTFLTAATSSTLEYAPVPVELVDFDYLITKDKLEEGDNVDDFITKETEFRTKAFGDCNVKQMSAGDIVQIERKGYFRLDVPYKKTEAGEEPAVFFSIPSGKVEKK